jgi:adenosylcobinamide-GDP ribazoletransferase
VVSTPPARGEGLGPTAAAGGRRPGLALTLGAWAAAAVLVAGPAAGPAALAAGAGATAAVVTLARRKIGGLTGDVAGAVEQVAEMTALVAVAAVGGPGRPWLAGLW